MKHCVKFNDGIITFHNFDNWQKDLFLPLVIEHTKLSSKLSECTSYDTIKLSKGEIKGMYFQEPPFDRNTIISVTQGKVLVVALNLIKSSSSYGKTFDICLRSDSKLNVYIPKGFAIGYGGLDIESSVVCRYDRPNNQASLNCIHYDSFNFNWVYHLRELRLKVSDNDKNSSLRFSSINSPF